MIRAFPFSNNRFQRSLHRRQKNLRSGQKFNGGQLRCNHPDALETSLCSSVGFERQEVLVAEMHGEFIKIWLEGDGCGGAEIVGFAARFTRESAKMRARAASEEESARPVPRARSIDRPHLDTLLFPATV